MDKMQFVELLRKKASGKATAEELKQIEDVFERFQQNGQNLAWTEAEQEEIKRRIKSRLPQAVSKEVVIDWKKYLIGIAASVLIFVAGYTAYQEYSFEPEIPILHRSTNSSQRAKVLLPDGTRVHLNVNSRLSFPEFFDTDRRVVELEGEAFFEVEKNPNKPFIVRTENLTTTVLGTSFNMLAMDGAAPTVTVTTGKVQVTPVNTNQGEVILLPDQQAVLLPSLELEVSRVNSQAVSAWRSNEVKFDLLPFDEVVALLAQSYHVKIELRGYRKNDCLIKASYANSGVEYILSGLQNLADFDYEIQQNGDVLIDYKNCKN
ncbi:ferric-dicitrate binding protein FerR (iron transport regulator) [Algoriphagus sp. 4150]|uniref:FecR family protein n=1 Tax=Algoriphagus sp. 4150 TaxID=2817756 RepID=UPI0028559EE7|nr:FecR domain-containing protein [Algoriphagus sp. 4150]MDR7130042.1 ferric-dicitrate binding protein FerR (iron transport regulator) [Algoriphagus sp. 4150]